MVVIVTTFLSIIYGMYFGYNYGVNTAIKFGFTYNYTFITIFFNVLGHGYIGFAAGIVVGLIHPIIILCYFLFMIVW